MPLHCTSAPAAPPGALPCERQPKLRPGGRQKPLEPASPPHRRGRQQQVRSPRQHGQGQPPTCAPAC
jgi:hypothetical protein